MFKWKDFVVLGGYLKGISYFCKNDLSCMTRSNINRLKIVLAEEQRSNKWLAEQLGKDQGTISKWVTNTTQPDLMNLMRIAKALNVDVCRLLNTAVIENKHE